MGELILEVLVHWFINAACYVPGLCIAILTVIHRRTLARARSSCSASRFGVCWHCLDFPFGRSSNGLSHLEVESGSGDGQLETGSWRRAAGDGRASQSLAVQGDFPKRCSTLYKQRNVIGLIDVLQLVSQGRL